MALKVEVAGFGVCQTNTPYSVFIVCVQQEKFEAWTVYRRYNSFNLLRDQLSPVHPGIPTIPHFDTDNLNFENLDRCRGALDKWLQSLSANSLILRMQSMYQFLCIDANMPPPYLDLHWRNSKNGSFDEMEMDDMFEKHLDGVDDAEMGDEDDDDDDEEKDEMRLSCSSFSHDHNDHVFNMDDHEGNSGGNGSPRHGNKKNGNARSHKPSKKRAAPHHQSNEEEDAKDGLDIQSLSVVKEAEFIYNKIDEGKASGEGAVAVKRTINLEAFKIIRVIGKGDYICQLFSVYKVNFSAKKYQGVSGKCFWFVTKRAVCCML